MRKLMKMVLGASCAGLRLLLAQSVLGAGSVFASIPTPEVPYLEWKDGRLSPATLPSDSYERVTASTRTLNAGWYIVDDAIVIDNAHLTVNGHTKLILCDGSSLTVNGDKNHAGIEVLSNNTLSIYGQANGTGRLALKGGFHGAGIGSGRQDVVGTVTINGGTVTVTGGQGAAGIGGGYECAGGEVTINGGIVTATGGTDGAGIGGADFGAGGTVTINGGIVTATGGTDGAGIGGGEFGDGGIVTINGGTVTATGGYKGAGIGGGQFGDGGTVTINGGRLKVEAGDDASVIGAGWTGSSQGTVEISGGIFAWKPNDDWLVDQSLGALKNRHCSKVSGNEVLI